MGGALRLAAARPEDAEEIARIHVAGWQAAYAGLLPEAYLASLSVAERRASWAASIAAATPDIWVARAALRMQGWIATGASRDPGAAAGTAELWALYLDPTAWGRGVGRALWADAALRLRAAGYNACTLWVFVENARARRFYERAGFVAEPASAQNFELGGIELAEVRYRTMLA